MMTESAESHILYHSGMTVEIVCCSVEDCVIATEAGADRIELCGGLEVGGMTPSIGMIRAARARTQLPIMVMIRPRGGGFDYSPEEFETMLHDIDAARAEGADGVVFGVLNGAGKIDEPRLKTLVERAEGLQTMHHRAFDVVPEPWAALEQIVACGVTRLLTSGRKDTAWEGRELLAELHQRAANRIEINPAGHIRPDNAKAIAEATGIPRIHLAPFRQVPEDSCRFNTEISFSGVAPAPEGTRTLTDGVAVAEVVQLFR